MRLRQPQVFVKEHLQVHQKIPGCHDLCFSQCGVESIRYRGDVRQADQLEKWLEALLTEYEDYILDINQDIAHVE